MVWIKPKKQHQPLTLTSTVPEGIQQLIRNYLQASIPSYSTLCKYVTTSYTNTHAYLKLCIEFCEALSGSVIEQLGKRGDPAASIFLQGPGQGAQVEQSHTHLPTARVGGNLSRHTGVEVKFFIIGHTSRPSLGKFLKKTVLQEGWVEGRRERKYKSLIYHIYWPSHLQCLVIEWHRNTAAVFLTKPQACSGSPDGPWA